MVALLWVIVAEKSKFETSDVIAFVALCGSVITYLLTVQAERRRLFVELHRELIRPEQQKARGVIWEWVTTEAWGKGLDDDDRRAAENALATLDMVALIAEKKGIDRDLFLDEWGPFLSLNGDAIRAAIKVRTEQEDRDVWPHLAAAVWDAHLRHP